LLEDAFVTCDRDALAGLFEDGAVLLAGRESSEARGCVEIAVRTAAMCDRGFSYLADARRVLRSRDTTLVVAERAVNVMRRSSDGRWRYAISLLDIDTTNERSRR
jgi:hypothetical protein